jgi:hypothetical protein
MAHTKVYRDMQALLLEEVCHTPGLLQGKGVKRREATELLVVCRHCGNTGLRPWTPTDNALHKTQGFTARAGLNTLATAWRGATKGHKQHAIKPCFHAYSF